MNVDFIGSSVKFWKKELSFPLKEIEHQILFLLFQQKAKSLHLQMLQWLISINMPPVKQKRF